MEHTDVSKPGYFHKVVDCQYACPTHTPVPEYIRLVAAGRYREAYLLNRESNVFPGVLGRVCDRPCEPACRRGRVDEDPVAICRIKRVAADFKGTGIENELPKIPDEKNGRKIAVIGAGPASLTVINDLLPLGYEFELFEKDPAPGGAMLSQVPSFRLPLEVLNEEIAMVLQRGGVDCHYGYEVTSLKPLLERFDSVFVGTGAPFGKDLKLPGRDVAKDQVHIGVEFLAAVSFKHVKNLQGHVLVIGGGNTAMDCCRTALRLGASKVTVVCPEAYEDMLASDWEKHDAELEGVRVCNHLLPKEFISKDKKLNGVRFSKVISCFDAAGDWNPQFSKESDTVLDCDQVIIAIGQRSQFSFLNDSQIKGSKNSDGLLERVDIDAKTLQSSDPRVFFGGDAAFGPKNIIWAVEHGHQAAISIHSYLSSGSADGKREQRMSLESQKMAMNQWSYSNDYSHKSRCKVPHRPVEESIKEIEQEFELGYDDKQVLLEASRCLNCDIQTVFFEHKCIECDACVDICPSQCLIMTENDKEERIRTQFINPATNHNQDLFVAPLPQTRRVMVKDENPCIHCGLCAERCPTGAWDMQAFKLKIDRAEDL